MLEKKFHVKVSERSINYLPFPSLNINFLIIATVTRHRWPVGLWVSLHADVSESDCIRKRTRQEQSVRNVFKIVFVQLECLPLT